jgi:hypothetical protein
LEAARTIEMAEYSGGSFSNKDIIEETKILEGDEEWDESAKAKMTTAEKIQ